jgi:hypothetical protein
VSEKVLRYETVACPYFNDEIKVLCEFVKIRAIGMRGEKFVRSRCCFVEECTCRSECPVEKM